MLSLYKKINFWLQNNERVAIATVIRTWGSSPRPIGAQMAVSENGAFEGSVSGGCVETAVIETAMDVLRTAHSKHLKFVVGDDDAFSVGLGCGGKIEIFVQSFQNSGAQKELLDRVLAKETGLYVISLKNGVSNNDDSFITKREDCNKLPAEIRGKCLKINASLEFSSPEFFENSKKDTLFLLPVLAPFKIVLVGAGHIAINLAELATILDYEIIIIDPRKILATKDRFPRAESIIPKWPQEAFPDLNLHKNCALIALSHDPKIDDPALEIALKTKIMYIGALGSKRTHKQRVLRLQKAGFSEEDIKRIHAPVGLDISAKTAEEIALSILAELIAVRRAS